MTLLSANQIAYIFRANDNILYLTLFSIIKNNILYLTLFSIIKNNILYLTLD